MVSHRPHRVAEEMKREIAQIIRDELKDPRIGFATITGVEVTPDIRYAKVFVSVYGDKEKQSHTLDALHKATGFIRTEIGRRIRLRYTPEIAFRLDESIARGARINELLHQVAEQEQSPKETSMEEKPGE